MNRDKVIDKVAKLLALASGSGGTEEERALALERAEEFMTTHRIGQHELAKVQGREALPGVEKVRVGKLGLGNMWKGQLMHAIGEGVGVDAIFVARLAARTYWLVGRPDAIAYVQLVADWIIPQLERECAKALKEARREHPGMWEWTENVGDRAAVSIEFKRSFYEQAVDRIDTRLRLMRRRRQGKPSTDLVRSDDAAKAEFYGANAPKQVEQRIYDGIGAYDGYEAGDRADLDPSNKITAPTRKELGS